MERQLVTQFAGRIGQESYRQFATFSPVLSAFPAASDLISFLHTVPTNENGTPGKDVVLAELLRGTTGNERSATSRELLLLAFVPMLHRVARQVITRSHGLAPEDVTQQVITALLESFDAPELAARNSHLAFALTRLLRRNTFAWAEREGRDATHPFISIDTLERVPAGGAQPIERAALLGHFLERCRQRGVLSEDDLELLLQFKLDELPNVKYSNASRQRMKRLLAKLRRAARNPPRAKFDDRQLHLF
jgi:hypothetical protein